MGTWTENTLNKDFTNIIMQDLEYLLYFSIEILGKDTQGSLKVNIFSGHIISNCVVALPIVDIFVFSNSLNERFIKVIR